MKLMFCGHCGDVVRLFMEKRTCKCGKSWGHYLEDGSTTVQTAYTLSLGLHNYDFQEAVQSFNDNRDYFSPVLSVRAWINPDSEQDVKYVRQIDEMPEESSPKDEE